jgi:hypothetical protein
MQSNMINDKRFNLAGMKPLKFLLFILIILVSHGTSFSQVFVKPNNSWGVEYNRMKWDSAAVIPSDTTLNKITGSVAILNGTFYIKNIFSWDALATGGSGTGGTLTWENVLDNGSDFSHSHLSNGNTNDLYFNNYGIITFNATQVAIPYLANGDVNNQWITTDGAGNAILKALPVPVDTSGQFFGNQDLQNTIDYGNRLRHANTIHAVGYDFYIDSLANHSTFSGKTATFDNQTGAYTEIHQDSANAYLYAQNSTNIEGSEVRAHPDSTHMQAWDSLGHNTYFTLFKKGTTRTFASVADTIDAPVINLAQFHNSDPSKVLAPDENGNVGLVTVALPENGTGTMYTVKDSTCTIPGSPATDDAYMVCGSPTGAWAGHALDIATWNGSSWDFTDAVAGDYAETTDDFITYIFRAGNWVRTSSLPLLVNGNKLGANLNAGTIDNRAFFLKTNNIQRLQIANTGAFTFNSLSGTGNVLMGLSSTGAASRVTAGTGITISGGTISASGGGGSGDTVNVSNVLSFGADSTGATDATSAINAAIQEAKLNGKLKVYIPHGTYKISITYLKSGGTASNNSGVFLLNGIELFGDGVGKTILTVGNNSTISTTNNNIFPVINGMGVSNCKVHDLEINGNKSQQGELTSNPNTNPAGYYSDTTNRMSTSGIQFKDGDNNEVYNVYSHDNQLEGIFSIHSTKTYIHNVRTAFNGSSGITFFIKSTGTVDRSLIDHNTSDNVRFDSCYYNISITNSEVSWSGNGEVGSSNGFAGIYCGGDTKNLIVANCHLHDAQSYGFDQGAAKYIQLLNNDIQYNGNGGIVTAGYLTVTGGELKNNGKRTDGTTDGVSNYNNGGVVVNSAVNLIITGVKITDTASGYQDYALKSWGGGGSNGFNFSTISNCIIQGIADTSHLYGGNSGTNNITNNLTYDLSGTPVLYGSSGQFLVLQSNGTIKFQPGSTGGSADVQTFTSNGTWTKPANAKIVKVICIGGGGGGGSGSKDASGAARSGASGGGSGGYSEATFDATLLTSTVTVSTGAGGTGGASVTANTTSGNNGNIGANSSFGSYLNTTGGAAGFFFILSLAKFIS